MIGDGNRWSSNIRLVHEGVLERDGTRNGDEWSFSRPFPNDHAHGDRNPSADWNPEKGVWTCTLCSQGRGYVDVTARSLAAPESRTRQLDPGKRVDDCCIRTYPRQEVQ